MPKYEEYPDAIPAYYIIRADKYDRFDKAWNLGPTLCVATSFKRAEELVEEIRQHDTDHKYDRLKIELVEAQHIFDPKSKELDAWLVES